MRQENLAYLLWAKTPEGTHKDCSALYHPLICHMLDTAAVVLVMWRQGLSPAFRNSVCNALSLDCESCGRVLAFLAGLHDIGKASPVFQDKYLPQRDVLEKNGLQFTKGARNVPHGVITARILRDLFRNNCTSSFARGIAVALAGHHGIFPTTDMYIGLGAISCGGEDWKCLRFELMKILYRLVQPPIITNINLSTAAENAFLVKLAGLTSVCDWIASSVEHFPLIGDIASEYAWEYFEKAKQQGAKALSKMGWMEWTPDSTQRSFLELFGFDKMRPLQEQVESIAKRMSGPGLVLIEAPMGEGKTEAALFLHDLWQAKEGQEGLYLALPTQATSNQMFNRVCAFLERRYPGERVNFHLMHGQAALSDHYSQLKLASVDIDGAEDQDKGTVVAEGWFTPKKRGLLAPFAVGTIDQSLLSILQVKHGFVRLFGLAHKTVIVDEVHAYDTYTSTLIDRMLEWFAVLGTSVVLLSATLPAQRRRELLQSYGSVLPEGECPYPRISWSSGESRGCSTFAAKPNPGFDVCFCGPDITSVAKELVDALEEGCAAWICNTVASSQEVYRCLEEICLDQDIELILFHARYPIGMRIEREKQVVEAFGKKSLLSKSDPDYRPRPRRAIVVATQVIEQSLDIDFDIMVTEVAPIDLILQRAGRLHRHLRTRPKELMSPKLWLIRPEVNESGVPDFGADSHVYCENILIRSWLTLKDLGHVEIPEDLERLIESVYGDLVLDESIPEQLHRHLERAQAEAGERRIEQDIAARRRVIRSPNVEDCLLESFFQDLDEDNPEVHISLQAATRLGEPSISVVCLHVVDGVLSFDLEGTDPVDMFIKPDLALEKKLLQCSVSLSHKGVVSSLLDARVPAAWQRSSLLRYHRCLEFVDHVTTVGQYMLRLDPELGIIIERT